MKTQEQIEIVRNTITSYQQEYIDRDLIIVGFPLPAELDNVVRVVSKEFPERVIHLEDIACTDEQYFYGMFKR